MSNDMTLRQKIIHRYIDSVAKSKSNKNYVSYESHFTKPVLSILYPKLEQEFFVSKKNYIILYNKGKPLKVSLKKLDKIR